MYERIDHPLLSRQEFLWRMLLHGGAGLALLVFSLALGMIGYWYYENLSWRDGFLNAAMLMGGMGPINAPVTNGGKVFAGLYALYAGLVFLVAASLALAPVVHRIMHKFHLDDEAE
ncbi:MAG: hypothetical protein SH868_07390 [Bythopirellula sp.]|nr:hypothetical protein [Bythopirellula sp.]